MRSMVCFIFSLLVSGAAFALVAGPSNIQGTVKSFDTKTVVVETEDSQYEIPRNLVGQKTLKAGEKIEVLLSIDQTNQIKVVKKHAEKK